MSDGAILPVGRFSPVSGLFVDRTEKRVEISGRMELFGPEATAARAQSITHSINTTWSVSFPDGYSVNCKVLVAYRAPDAKAKDLAQIEAIKIAGPSHVSMLTRAMTLNANEADAFTWVAAHEFGHVIGLQDRYSEGIMSKLRGTFGGTRSTTVDPLYKANLMGVSGGVLESRNLKDLAVENNPSPLWVNDDAQVRDWVNHHPLAEVTALSTTNKISMISTLMGGWVSEEDVAAIVRICSSVVRAAEAVAIRSSVDTIGFTDLGQRTRVRVAIASMF
jgi:hypothetical protein